MKRLILLATILVLLVGLAPVSAQDGDKVAFRTGGGWDAPPAFHGNTYAESGCCGSAWWFIWEPFFHYVPNTDEIVMRLAESYAYDEEALVSTVKLVEGSMWHDGEAVTADDVVTTFTMERANRAGIWNFIDSIEAVDDMTINFNWSQVTPVHRQLLAGVMIRGPQHIYGEWADQFAEILDDEANYDEEGEWTEEANTAVEDIWDSLQEFRPELPVGSGPFMLTTVTESTMIMDKFMDHPAADMVEFDQVIVHRSQTAESGWNLVQSGMVDAFHPGSPPDVVEGILASRPELEYILASDLAEFAMYFNPTVPPMDDVAFRRALLKIFDRPAMQEMALFYALPADDYAHGMLFSLKDAWFEEGFLDMLTPYPYDPAAAEQELLDAGYTKENGAWMDKEGNPITFTVGGPAAYHEFVIACEVTAETLTDFGMESVCQPRDMGVVWQDQDDLNYEIDAGWMATYWGTGHPFTAYSAMLAEDGWQAQRVNYDDDNTFMGPDGEEVNVHDLIVELGAATEFERQQDLIQTLAYVLNEDVRMWPYLEKQIGIYIDHGTVDGWPEQGDPYWSMCPGGIEKFYTWMMVTGQLVPAAE